MCFKKIISLVTVAAFLLTNTGYAATGSRSIFKDKKVDYNKISSEQADNIDKKKAVLQGESVDKERQASQKKETQRILSSHLSDLSQIHIPEETGRVIEVYQAADDAKGKRPLVVHIQDLHTNPEGELNLAKILEILLKDYNLGLVCSEGADGAVDTSSVSSFPDSQVREKVAKLFINSGELTGEEYLSITKYPNLAIWGIENKDVYFKNIVEFNNIMKFNPDSETFISQVKQATEQLKPKIYSKELLAIDQKESDYEAKKIETSEFLKYLTDYLQKLNIKTDEYKNVSILNETIAMEPKIDQAKIMQESQNLLLNLQSYLSSKSLKTDMDTLVAEATLFKDQKVSPFSFYSYLKDLAEKHLKEGLSKYPNLAFFVDYLTKVNSLDSTKLFIEMETVAFDIKQRVAKNEEEKTLTQAIRNIKFLESFFNLKISNEELDYYLNNRDSHKVSFFEAFLKPAIKKYNINTFIDYNPALIDSHLQEIEDFYGTVKQRDLAMFTNSVSEIEKRNVKVAALVTGGFHTKGLTRMLKEKGYSYIVISPFSKTEIDEENYRYLLSGKRKPIEELIKDLDLPKTASKPSANLRVPLMSSDRDREVKDRLEAAVGITAKGNSLASDDTLLALMPKGTFVAVTLDSAAQTIRTQPTYKVDMSDEIHRDAYYAQVLKYVHDVNITTGMSYRLVDKDMRGLRAFIEGKPGEYSYAKGRNRKEADFTIGGLSGTRKIYGVDGKSTDRVFHLEYGMNLLSLAYRNHDTKSILTYHTNKSGQDVILVNPKKTILVYGFGTIASQVAKAALKSGIEVIVSNRSFEPAKKAARTYGFDIVTTKDYVGGKDVAAEFKGAEFVTGGVEDLLRSGVISAIVEGVDGKLKEKDAVEVAKKYGITIPEGVKKFTNFLVVQELLFRKLAPNVPIILQGGNDHKQAGLVFESSTAATLGSTGFDALFKTADGSPKTIYHTSCNTTSLSSIVAILNVIEPYINQIEVLDTVVNRRQADRGKKVKDVGPEGRSAEIGYHWPTELLPLLKSQPDQRLYKKIRTDSKGSPTFTATGGMTEQTLYHVGRINLRVRLKDGTYLTSDQLLRAALEVKNRRLAIIQTDPKKPKAFDSLPVYYNFLREQGLTNPNISTISISPLGTDNVEIKFLTLQESNVIPSELATLIGLLRLTPSMDLANSLSNEVLGVDAVVERLEQKLPVSNIRAIAQRSIEEVMAQNVLNPKRAEKAELALLKPATITKNPPKRVDVSFGVGKSPFAAQTVRYRDIYSAENKFKEHSRDGDEYYNIFYEGTNIAILRINRYNQAVKAVSLIGNRPEYYSLILKYIHNMALEGEAIEFQDTDLYGLKAFIEGKDDSYQAVPGRNRLESSFAIGDLTGTRKKYGYIGEDTQNRVFHLDYGQEGKPRAILTYHTNSAGEDTIIINPKKRILVYGFGTIASQVARAALKSGVEVIVSNRSFGPALQAAGTYGFDVVTTKDYVGGKDVAAEFKGANFVTGGVEDLLRSGVISAIVEGVDGKLKEKDAVEVAKKYGITIPEGVKKFTNFLVVQELLFRKLAPDVPIILQGGNDHKQADLVFESSAWQAMGYEDFGALFNENGSPRTVYHTSCNTTSLAQITSVLSVLKNDIAEIEVSDVFITRRADDRAKAKALAAQQATMEGDYHWNTELNPLLFDQVDPELRLKFRMNAKAEPDMTATGASAGQTSYHFGVYNLRVKMKDGTYLTPKAYKEAALKLTNRRLAIIQTTAKDKTVDSLAVLNHLLWDQDINDPYISTAQVAPLGADGIAIAFQTFQESNVIPSELATLFGLLGFTDSLDLANRKANEVLGVNHIVRRLEERFPAEGVEYSYEEERRTKLASGETVKKSSLPKWWDSDEFQRGVIGRLYALSHRENIVGGLNVGIRYFASLEEDDPYLGFSYSYHYLGVRYKLSDGKEKEDMNLGIKHNSSLSSFISTLTYGKHSIIRGEHVHVEFTIPKNSSSSAIEKILLKAAGLAKESGTAAGDARPVRGAEGKKLASGETVVKIEHATLMAKEGIQNPEGFKKLINQLLDNSVTAVVVAVIAERPEEINALRTALIPAEFDKLRERGVKFSILDASVIKDAKALYPDSINIREGFEVFSITANLKDYDKLITTINNRLVTTNEGV